MKYEQDISVDFQYPVIFTRSVFAPSNPVLTDVLPSGTSKMVFYADSGLIDKWPDLPEMIERWAEKHADQVDMPAPCQIVRGGEEIKNDLDILDTVGQLCADLGLDRHSYIGIAGGGAVLDAVGFAAASVHRGIRQVRFPTTTMSQGDSGVGVKNGVNRFGIKNFYGTFQPPDAVVCDTEFLRTLSRRDWLSGVGEAFKVAITQEREFFDFLKTHAGDLADGDEEVMEEVVQETARLHLDHIRHSRDPFERGSERPLDFGHWVGHRLEEITDYELPHGEAVAIGIAVDACCATGLGLLVPDERDEILSAMRRCGLSVWHETLTQKSDDGQLDVLLGLERFRQHLGGQLTLVMPDGLGDMVHINELPTSVITDAVEYLRSVSP